tara:strand:- start:218 stop:370 length:153 start_codon:yes stop_codon:yes gene_type:complete
MKKKKYEKQRNYVVVEMIERSQNAGSHIDKKKEDDKGTCRKKIDIKNIED